MANNFRRPHYGCYECLNNPEETLDSNGICRYCGSQPPFKIPLKYRNWSLKEAKKIIADIILQERKDPNCKIKRTMRGYKVLGIGVHMDNPVKFMVSGWKTNRDGQPVLKIGEYTDYLCARIAALQHPQWNLIQNPYGDNP